MAKFGSTLVSGSDIEDVPRRDFGCGSITVQFVFGAASSVYGRAMQFRGADTKANAIDTRPRLLRSQFEIDVCDSNIYFTDVITVVLKHTSATFEIGRLLGFDR